MRDMTVCYMCKLTEPHVNIRLVKGKPRGECSGCYNAREQRRRNKAALYSDFYDRGRKLADWNYNQLASLPLGAYALVNRKTKATIGQISILEGKTFARVWDDRYLFKQDLYGISLWLSNLGLAIDAPIEAADNGADLKPDNVASVLYMFDQALQDYAVKRIKDELDAVKKKSKAFAKA